MINIIVKKKVLFEDVTMQYNKWVSGVAAREFSAQRLKFKDLVNQHFDTDQSPNTVNVGKVLPYQLANAANVLSMLFDNVTNAIGEFKNALEAPLVKEDEKITKEVEQTIHHLENAFKDLQAIITIFEKDDVQSTNKDSKP